MTEKDILQTQDSGEQSNIIESQKKESTRLQQVREGLKSDNRVYFASEILESNYGYGWLEAVNIIVAPNKPIYDANKLNEFMDSLIPDIPRSARDSANKYDKNSDFSLGKLYFDEKVGETTRVISSTTTAVDPDALTRSSVHIGRSQKTETETLKRRVWVRVYPDINSAQIIAEYEQGVKEGTIEPNSTFGHMQHWFSAEQFEKLRKSRKKPIFKRLKLPKGK